MYSVPTLQPYLYQCPLRSPISPITLLSLPTYLQNRHFSPPTSVPLPNLSATPPNHHHHYYSCAMCPTKEYLCSQIQLLLGLCYFLMKLLYILYMRDHFVFGNLPLTNSTQHDIPQIHSYSSKLNDFIFSYYHGFFMLSSVLEHLAFFIFGLL